MDSINYSRTIRREIKMYTEAVSGMLLSDGASQLCVVTENSDWAGDPPIVWRMDRNMLERFEAREEI